MYEVFAINAHPMQSVWLQGGDWAKATVEKSVVEDFVAEADIHRLVELEPGLIALVTTDGHRYAFRACR